MKPVHSAYKCAFCVLLSIGLILSSNNQAFSQEFGRFRPGIKWQQINDSAVRVIFPEGLEAQATRVASNIRYVNQNSLSSVGNKTKKINLILNNQGIISNGYVTVGPYRSEFYTTPLQDGFALGTLPWLDLLSLHEYRHALQYINGRRGFTKLAWLLTGDTGWGTLLNLTIPGWYFEGDAVATETALSKQGRGRIPNFLQQYKSILAEGKPYSYMKARNGSYRDMVPNEYELGYLLCSYGRENYGNELWKEVLNTSTLLSGVFIYPFALSLWGQTDLVTGQFYKKAFADYKLKWEDQLSETLLTPAKPITRVTRTYTDYQFPTIQQDGSLLVYKTSYKKPGAIYRITPNSKEKRLFNLGITQDPYFSASRNLIAWTEVTWDQRYSSENYSDVVLFQTDLGKKKYLTSKQRYFSPALSPDGSQVVVVEVDPTGKCLMKIIDSQTGKLINTLPNEDQLYYTYPKWDTDGKSILSSARTTTGSMLIISQKISDGTLTRLTPDHDQIMGELLVMKDSILFSCGVTGTNNIFSLSRTDGKIRQLTSTKFGAYNPAIDPTNKRLVYSDFGKRGYRIVSAPMDSLTATVSDFSRQDKLNPFDFKYFDTEGGDILGKIPSRKFEITPYGQLEHAVKVHSWNITPSFSSIGVTLISDNILNNVHLEGGANYFYNENSPGINALVQYGGFYPLLSAGFSRNYRYKTVANPIGIGTNPTLESLDNLLSAQVEIPLDFTKGEFFRQADIQFGYDFISSKDLASESDSFRETTVISSVGGTASYAAVRRKALQNITTPLGFKIELTANQSINKTKARQVQAIADFAVRGLTPNHSLVVSAGWKSELVDNDYQYMDLFLYPRGYSIPTYDKMISIQSSYHFPIAYPDWGFWGIFYCSRVRASLFADYGRATIPASLNSTSDGNFTSTGVELILDTRILNIIDLPLGVRFSLLLNDDMTDPNKKTKIEFVLPIIRL
jgi:hypothetical protein